MGEIAEMMLDGTLCAGCGVYLDQEPEGYPIYCAGCQPDERDGLIGADAPVIKQKCPICGARKANVIEHAKAKHPRRWEEARDHE